MKRLGATMRVDFVLQWRNGFYHASLFVAVLVIVAMRSLFDHAMMGLLLPYFLFINMCIAFYFIAGLILLEKGEGTLESLVVSPLRTVEYIASKAVTLTAMMLLENLVILYFTYGFSFSWWLLLMGALFLSLQYALLGLIVIARYDSIPDFIMPAILAMTVIQFPFFRFIEAIPEWIFVLWPTYGPLLLFQGAFQPLGFGDIVYAVLYSLVSIMLFYYYAHRSFERFIVRGEHAA